MTMEFVVWNTASGYQSFRDEGSAIAQCRDPMCKMLFSPNHEWSLVRKGSSNTWRRFDRNGRRVGELYIDPGQGVGQLSLATSQMEAIDPTTRPLEIVGVRACVPVKRLITHNTKCPSRSTTPVSIDVGP